jgi:glutamate 5-kinase
MRRIVVKIGSSSLTSADGVIEPKRLAAIAHALNRPDLEVALVSSGAVAAGAGLLKRGRPRTLPEKQAYAAIGQAALMQHWATACAPRVVAQVLLSAGDIQARGRFVNAKRALDALFKLGALPILNENDTVATEELKLGDNDRLSAWVAYLIDADQLVLLTDVDGLFSANPATDPSATRIDEVSDLDAVMPLAGGAGSTRGTGGMLSKLKAAQIAAAAGIETFIIGDGGAGLARWLDGAAVGTRILATPGAARRGWILHQPSLGRIEIDPGARAALQRGRSLLPSGIVNVEGSFDEGDAVALTHAGEALGQGLVNYRAADLKRIAGKRSDEIESILGHKDFDEAIHRDQLALKG